MVRGKHNRKHQSYKSRHKKRTRKPVKLKYEEPDELKRAPHSFVIHRGTVGKHVLALEKNFRNVMEPFTASSLQVLKKNTLKDFVSVSSALKVSHLVIFTNSAIGPYMRIARLPHGPTLMFRIHNYSLGCDVISSLKKQMTNKKLYTNAPLIILNNFTGDGTHITLMASVFQNMFPTINVTKVKLSDIRRCVMLNYNSETKMIDFRHYAIKAVPIGISRSVKKIVQSKIPNLSKYKDISEFLTKPSVQSESEAEDDPNSHVEVPQKLHSRGNIVSQQSSIRLSELGPRMTLQLLKVEEGLLNGEVLFHELITKTEAEKKIIRKKLLEKRRIKEQRRREQEANIKKKEEQKQKLIIEMKRKQQSYEENELAVDDDVEYFKEEVGHDPDEGVFHNNPNEKMKERRFRKRKANIENDDKPKNKDDRRKKKFPDSSNDNHFKKKRFRRSTDENTDSKQNSRSKKRNQFKEDDKFKMKNDRRKFKRPSKLVNKIRSNNHKKASSGKSKVDRRRK